VASVVLYFQVHQPWRLRRYSAFDSGHDYFDVAGNRGVLQKVAARCYRPATELLLKLVQRYGRDFRLSISLSGTAADQLRQHAPEVIDLLQALAGSGCCEFLGETYYHSLTSLFWPEEFAAHVERHSGLMQQLFGHSPRVFRNTELIYSNQIAAEVAALTDVGGQPRFIGMLAEGVDHILEQRSPNVVYRSMARLPLLLRNYRLSDDIAFRFSNRAWGEWPLTAEKFAGWIVGNGPVCNLYMDLETLGEHQWAESGIFQFLEGIPGQVLARGHRFLTAAEAFAEHAADAEYNCPTPTSWADTERDLSAWLGNAMQVAAAEELYRAGRLLPEGAAELREQWRRLTTSDHLYYMCTKYFSDGDVHKYFNPYESPYEAFINFMNVLENVQSRVAAGEGKKVPHPV
jgi:alpha-amylase